MNDYQEFEQLLQAHANKELTTDERMQLAALAKDDPERQRAVGGFRELHRFMDDERRLTAAVMVPPDPSEETDESYRRMAQAAARAEQQLGAKLMNPVHREGRFGAPRFAFGGSASRKNRRLWFAFAAAAAAALVAALLVFDWGPDAPPLNPDQPGPDKIGRPANIILLNPVLTASDLRLSWRHVQGARSYDARILDTDNAVVLARAFAQARSNEWWFTKAEYDVLKTHPGDLFLRVVARDGVGVGFATTSERKLDVR
ncbi:MAG: hypothetical protein ACYTGW_14570 [Planctomycetota bacterium]